MIKSRIGIESEAIAFHTDDDLFDLVHSQLETENVHCVLVDVDPEEDVTAQRDLIEELGRSGVESQVAFRRGTRYVARLSRGAKRRRDPEHNFFSVGKNTLPPRTTKSSFTSYSLRKRRDFIPNYFSIWRYHHLSNSFTIFYNEIFT